MYKRQDLVIYDCTSGYPVPFEDICLLEITRLRELYADRVKSIGFSGHHLGIAVDSAAVALGAEWIERHYTLDRTWKGTDHAASLEPDGVRKLARDCRAVAKAGKRDSGTVETGIVREAISVSGMGSGGKYLVGQVTAMRSEIFNTSLSAEGRAVLLYHVERMNEESANALLKVMEEPPEGVLFLLTADSLASVLPTIRSRCVSFAVAPVSPADCTRYCAAQGVDKKTAALYSELFDGHIGTVLAVARDEARAAQVEKALELARAAAARDSYTAAVLLAAYEKDKAAAAALLTDFRAVAAAGLRSSPRAPVQGTQARQAVRLADAALQRLGAQVNPKVVLTVFAAKLRTL